MEQTQHHCRRVEEFDLDTTHAHTFDAENKISKVDNVAAYVL